MDLNLLYPLGPERCLVLFDYFFEETEGPQAEAFIAESRRRSAAIQMEDMEVCQRVQRGLRSASYDRGRYAPRWERVMHHFHGLLANDLEQLLRLCRVGLEERARGDREGQVGEALANHTLTVQHVLPLADRDRRGAGIDVLHERRDLGVRREQRLHIRLHLFVCILGRDEVDHDLPRVHALAQDEVPQQPGV